MRGMLAVVATALMLTTAPAVAKEEKPAEKDKLICKRVQETGSLIKTKKQCFTRAEWDRIAESEQAGAGRMIDDLRTRPAGGT